MRFILNEHYIGNKKKEKKLNIRINKKERNP